MATKTYTKSALNNSTKVEKVTPQTQVIRGRENDMKSNNAGGVSFTVTPWTMLDRFLILGSEGGTYYVSENTLTEENAKNTIECIKLDGIRTVQRIVEISDSGRAPKNDPALFALALALTYGNEETRKFAAASIRSVARIGTHILHLAEYVNSLRGWGRVIRNGFGAWYAEQSPKALAMNLVKYANRDGWTHRDILRLAHPTSVDEAHKQLLAYAADKSYDFSKTDLSGFMNAVELVKRSSNIDEIVRLIVDYKLPREVIPTNALNNKEVWEALLPHMGMTAMVRNLATMTRVGVLGPLGDATKLVRNKMRDEEELKRSRFHPIAALSALMTYSSGKSVRGNNSWTPIQSIVDELDSLFERSFGYVTPTNKRMLMAFDTSASMTWSMLAGVPGLTPRMASAAMGMIAARTEEDYMTVGFSDDLQKFDLSKKTSIHEAIRIIEQIPAGGTDCALPMQYALAEKIPVDAFVVYTDYETWYGNIHPCQALTKYRNEMGIPAKLIVVGMTATDISIADPTDGGSLDVCGMDTSTPNLISDFIRE